MVEAQIDKSMQCSRVISGIGNMHYLMHLKMLCKYGNQLENKMAYHSLGIIFAWDNFRLDGIQVLARLNKCYAFTLNARQTINNYKIHGDDTSLDHNPISMFLQFGLDL